MNVNVQYQNWGDHLQKFDATLAGGGGPDVIEMGNTEMTKYMAAGAFADITPPWQVRQLEQLAQGPCRVGRTPARPNGVPYYAGSRVVTYRSDLYKKAGISKLPARRASSWRMQEARCEERQEGLLAGLHRRHGLVLAMGFVFDYGG